MNKVHLIAALSDQRHLLRQLYQFVILEISLLFHHSKYQIMDIFWKCFIFSGTVFADSFAYLFSV